MYCGTTVILKEAIQTVKIDNSHMIQNWINMGLSAYNSGNNQEAYSYFTKVIENDPANWKAIFYKGMAAGWQSTMAKPRITEAMDGIVAAQEILLTISDISQEEKDLNIILFAVEIYGNIKAYFKLWADYSWNHNNDYNADRRIEVVYKMINCLKYMEFPFYLLEQNPSPLMANNPKAESIKHEMRKFMASELCIWICSYDAYWSDYKETTLLYWGLSVKDKQKYIDIYDNLLTEIRKVEPDFKDKIFRDEPSSVCKPKTATAKSACYIATAVYGSHDAPEVLMLRKFRDDILANYFFGRLFIKLYYAISPPIANKLKYAKRINKIAKRLLDRFVFWLENN